jgi:hypothetical protein
LRAETSCGATPKVVYLRPQLFHPHLLFYFPSTFAVSTTTRHLYFTQQHLRFVTTIYHSHHYLSDDIQRASASKAIANIQTFTRLVSTSPRRKLWEHTALCMSNDDESDCRQALTPSRHVGTVGLSNNHHRKWVGLEGYGHHAALCCARWSQGTASLTMSVPSRGIEGFYCRLCLLVGLA